ncbi:4515_t:CDS:1, partial [Entrophospora sp. SA101]
DAKFLWEMNIDDLIYTPCTSQNWKNTPSKCQIIEAYRTKLSPEFTGITVQHLLLCLALYLQLGDKNSTAEIVEDVDIFNQLCDLVFSNPNLLKQISTGS